MERDPRSSREKLKGLVDDELERVQGDERASR
jgi:hypothetical protein